MRYDNNGVLTTLSTGRYGVHWVYISANSKISVIYGTANYTLTTANTALAPGVLPAHFEKHAILIAKNNYTARRIDVYQYY